MIDCFQIEWSNCKTNLADEINKICLLGISSNSSKQRTKNENQSFSHHTNKYNYNC